MRGRDINLSVEYEDNSVWRWRIVLDNGILDEGLTTTRLSAQVAVQRTFEKRMQHAGVSLVDFTGYRWSEVVTR